MPVDALNHVTGFQPGFSGGGAGIHLRHHGAMNGVWNVELFAGLRIEVAHADAVERAGIISGWRAGLGQRFGSRLLFDGDFECLFVAVAQNLDRHF